MSETIKTIVVFTSESVDEILANRGGTGYWTAKRENAQKYRYVVCVRNKEHSVIADDVPHRKAFLLGEIVSVENSKLRAKNGKPKLLIRFRRYALLHDFERDAWHGAQNPIGYTDLETLGISLGDLEWHDMPPVTQAESIEEIPPSSESPVAQAKQMIADFYHCPVEAVHVTISV